LNPYRVIARVSGWLDIDLLDSCINAPTAEANDFVTIECEQKGLQLWDDLVHANKIRRSLRDEVRALARIDPLFHTRRQFAFPFAPRARQR